MKGRMMALVAAGLLFGACGGGTTIESEIYDQLDGIWIGHAAAGSGQLGYYHTASSFWGVRDECFAANSCCRRFSNLEITNPSKANGNYYFTIKFVQSYASCDVEVGSTDSWQMRIDSAGGFRIASVTADPSRLDDEPFGGETGNRCSADHAEWGSTCTDGMAAPPWDASGNPVFSTAGSGSPQN